MTEPFEVHANKVSERSVQLFNHILNAHQIWNGRIEHEKNLFGIWEIHPIQDLKNINNLNYETSLRILDKYDLNQIVNYQNSKGDSFSNRVSDILFHIINHATYHTGQIATEFRQSGIEPLVTDYIFYKR